MKDKYIKIYDNVLDQAQCLHYISLIEKGERKPGRHVGKDGNPTIDKEVKDSEDVCFTTEYPEDTNDLLRITGDLINRYEKDVETHVPAAYTETFRGRVYRENIGHFRSHIDVSSGITYGRTITILFFLNNIEKGGKLYFENQDIIIDTIAGRVVMFPPYWLYRHQASKSLEGDRYILRTFVKGPQ